MTLIAVKYVKIFDLLPYNNLQTEEISCLKKKSVVFAAALEFQKLVWAGRSNNAFRCCSSQLLGSRTVRRAFHIFEVVTDKWF